MGITRLTIDVGCPPNPTEWVPVHFLIDSGAMHSVVPAAILLRLGIPALREQEFRLANGDRITRRMGMAAFRYRDRVGAADVVFGEPGDSNLLGAFTLESLGYGLDPLKRELVDLPMVL